jgi:quercetin dioxygenase-like cupin family protein
VTAGYPARYVVRRAAQADWAGPGDEALRALAPASTGLRRWPVVGEASGAVHTGFAVCELDPGGSVGAHVHSFEESWYVLAGSVVVQTSEGAFRLTEGDYGFVPVGMPHSWRNDGDGPARWAEMLAPAPRARCGQDTVPVPALPPTAAVGVDVRDPRTRSFGHIEPSNMDAGKQTQDLLAVSASMRTALLVYSGITVRMMVDSDLGAELATMFMVGYDPDGVAGPHDHPFEETYLFLEGDVEATFDGERHRLGPGDVGWAGVGCVHSFRNAGTGPVRWLETQAPQPPGRHSYRFARDWDYLRSAVD